MNSEPRRTRDEASREDQNTEDRQPFPMGSTDSTVMRVDREVSRGPQRPFKKFGVVTFNYSMSNPLYVSFNQVSSFRLGLPSSPTDSDTIV